MKIILLQVAAQPMSDLPEGSFAITNISINHQSLNIYPPIVISANHRFCISTKVDSKSVVELYYNEVE